jgi:hypothetical protein
MRIAARTYTDAAQLAEIDARLALMPASTNLRFERACALEDLGWDDAAADAYRDLIEREPTHLGARTNLGVMLRDRGDLAAAHALLAPAVAAYPLSPLAHVNLAKTLAELGESDAAIAHFTRALQLDPAFFAAHHGLALVYEAAGDDARAADHFARAFAHRATWTLPFRGTGVPLRVLLLVSGRGGDLVAHPFLDDRTVETTMLVPEGMLVGAPLPPHDVVFNGIGDADRCRAALERASVLIGASARATINDPGRVLGTGRAAIAERMASIDGVVAPRIERVARERIDEGFIAPTIVRAPGYHAGRHCALVTDRDELAGVVATLPGAMLYRIAFIDTRGIDGRYRKYRLLFIDGRAYPVHLAIAHEWKVHYFSADMTDNAAHRAEEQRFLADPAAALGERAWAALAQIGERIGLDYAGVDFALGRDGNVVVFEANATMAVYPPEADPRWDYRRPAYDAVIAAVRAMIEEHSR